jgi:hypothetical protein
MADGFKYQLRDLMKAPSSSGKAPWGGVLNNAESSLRGASGDIYRAYLSAKKKMTEASRTNKPIDVDMWYGVVALFKQLDQMLDNQDFNDIQQNVALWFGGVRLPRQYFGITWTDKG